MRIAFREITLVTVWSTEWKGRFRKQGDRLRGHCKTMWLEWKADSGEMIEIDRMANWLVLSVGTRRGTKSSIVEYFLFNLCKKNL